MPDQIKSPRPTGGLVLALMLAATCLLAGCGENTKEDAGPAPSVASVATAAAPAAAGKKPPTSGTPSAPAKERLYYRPDMTDDEVIRLSNMYESCLIEHGVPAVLKGKQVKSWEDGSAKYKDARAACQDKKAEQYEERLARVDPAGFQDYLRITLNCLKAGGLKARMNAAGNDIDIDPKAPVAKALDVQTDCGMKAYNQTK